MSARPNIKTGLMPRFYLFAHFGGQLMAEIEQKPTKRDAGDTSVNEPFQSSPFDDLLREMYGQPSARGNDDSLGRSDVRGSDKTVTEKDAQFLDMETGEVFGDAPRGLAGSDAVKPGVKDAEKTVGKDSEKSGAKDAEKPGVKDAAPAEQKNSSADDGAKDIDEGEDFAILNKSKFPPKQEASGGDDGEDFNILKKSTFKKANSDNARAEELEKARTEAAQKFASLPNFVPDPTRDTKFDTSVDKLTGWLDSNFDKLDADQNGTVTRDELGKQIENPALANGEGGVYLATAYGAANNWKNLADELSGTGSSSGESGPPVENEASDTDPNVGITRDGIKSVRDNLGKFDSKEEKAKHSIKSITSDFEALDTNNDQTITMAELDNALSKGDFGKETREKFETLKRNFKQVAATTDDVVKPEPGIIDPKILRPTDNGEPLKDVDFVSALDLNEFKGSDAVSLQESLDNHTKHLASDLPVSQGQTGSCFVLAPVSAILDKDPKFFEDKIKDLGDGKLQVKLPDNEGRYGNIDTVISKPTDAERARFGGGETAAIVEKAFSQHLKTLMGEDKPKVVQEQILSGGNEHKAISSMTGNSSVRTSPQAEEAKVRAELNLVNDPNKGVTAGTHQKLPDGTGLMHKHVYQVSGFDQKTGDVELTNPHRGDFGGAIEPLKPDGGARDGNLDGKFKISFADFQKHFEEINTFDIRKK
jgi:hypothetical protein